MNLSDETIMTFDNEKIILRPTLRAGMRLEKRYGSFDAIIRSIAEQNVSTMADVVRETSAHRSNLLHFLEICEDDAAPMMLKVGALVEPLISVTLAIVGVDAEEATDAEEANKDRSEDTPANPSSASFSEHFAQLYRIGTGWLSWTPEATLNATPAEIIEAYNGRIQMLRAIFGMNEDGKSDHGAGASDWQKDVLNSDDGGLSDYRASLAGLGIAPGKRKSFGIY